MPSLAGRSQPALGLCAAGTNCVCKGRPSPRQLESLGTGQQVTQHRLTCARESRLFLVRGVFKAGSRGLNTSSCSAV